MTPQQLVDLAEQDRFALIYDEEYEEVVMANIREIARLCLTTGVLVRQNHGGTAYHVSSIQKAEAIARNGLQPNEDDTLTYGGGVVYTYPSLDHYTGLNEATHAIFKVEYSAGTMRAIATYDKSDQEQGEIIIPPECIVSVIRIHLDGTPWEITGSQFAKAKGVRRMSLQ